MQVCYPALHFCEKVLQQLTVLFYVLSVLTERKGFYFKIWKNIIWADVLFQSRLYIKQGLWKYFEISTVLR